MPIGVYLRTEFHNRIMRNNISDWWNRATKEEKESRDRKMKETLRNKFKNDEKYKEMILKRNRLIASNPERNRKISTAFKGERHPRWKGGRWKTSGGYVNLLVPGKYSDYYVYEHRWMMEQMLGRFLRKGEEVHHFNEDKSDNRPENLVLMPTKVIHTKWHKLKK